MPEKLPLWERIRVLRDEVLNTAELGDLDAVGGEVFDAVVRWLLSQGETSPGLDLTLHEALSQRLAWGDPETVVLANADSVCRRLLDASFRALREPVEQMAVAEAVTEVGCIVARIVASASLGRAGRERAATLREEVVQIRLDEELDRQKSEINALERVVAKHEP